MVTRAFVFSKSLKYLLIIFNIAIRSIVIAAVKWIGYPTETKQLEQITLITFLG